MQEILHAQALSAMHLRVALLNNKRICMYHKWNWHNIDDSLCVHVKYRNCCYTYCFASVLY